MNKKPTNQPNQSAAEPDAQATQLAELTADLQRTRADFENYRKQVDLQKHQAIELAKETTVAAILPLLDQLQLAIHNYSNELAPLAKTFDKTLQDFGLQLIPSAPDTEFNPELHEAVMVEDSDGDKEVISETLRPGYYYHNEVLRPAMVKVKRI